jgi:high-affinity iron transporter
MKSRGAFITVALLALGNQALAVSDYASAAEDIRAKLVAAQLEMVFDKFQAEELVLQAQTSFNSSLQNLGKTEFQNDFQTLKTALKAGNETQFAQTRSKLWTGILNAAYIKLENAVRSNDANTAGQWLNLREYRLATRFTSPDSDATLAIGSLTEQKISSMDALTAVRADYLDAYQARLNDALHDLASAQKNKYAVSSSEMSTAAKGYFQILSSAYKQNFGEPALKDAQNAFSKLEQQPLNAANLNAVKIKLEGFRAAPLSPRERAKRASQTLRFLALVPVEYGRGVSESNGATVVNRDLEITEAKTFLTSAASAFSDLEPALVKTNKNAVTQIKNDFAKLELGLNNASLHNSPPSFKDVQQDIENLNTKLEQLIPADWRRADPSGDLDVIKSQLRQLENAVGEKSFDLAESARVSAYAMLESGTEARIKVFQPQLATAIESLFWNGVEPDGLARLISRKASVTEFKTTRLALEQKLEEASRYVGTNASPTSTFVNALVIVFREGLEAVLILAALLGSLKAPAVRHLRRPLWMGAAASFVATIITFMVMQRILNAFAIFGEKLEAVVSVIAVAVLLVIMNWFFHNVYWNDHLANFHKKKHQLMGTNIGQGLGLAVLGFTAMYREGFETVLFMQSLVLQSGLVPVLSGAAIALVLVTLVGVLVFVLQSKLPHKKMLVATGAMICVVLFVIVGNTTHMLQVVGWMSIHPLPVVLPYWTGLWLGTYATYEGIVLQVVAVGFVVGSYFVAEAIKRKELFCKISEQNAKTTPSAIQTAIKN